jgi:hypothetical protein
MSNCIFQGKIRKFLKYFYQENTFNEPGYNVHLWSSTFIYKIIGYEMNVVTYVSKKNTKISHFYALFF